MDQGGDEQLPVKSISYARKHAIFGFCLLISLISFKPSEPYLSEYLTCNLTDQKAICNKAASDAESCNSVLGGTCKWIEFSTARGNNQATCEVESCNTVTQGCGMTDNAFRHCKADKTSGLCSDLTCYKRFTESQVNNEIYPWSSYAYLPLLLILSSAAEVFSYRNTIIFGILGRLATRYLLLFGNSLIEMQIMQLTYSIGSAAEDVFKAYVYYAVPEHKYQEATSCIAASALLSSVFAGLIADFLVLSGGVSLEVLMIISACFVTAGTVVSFIVIQPPDVDKISASRSSVLLMNIGESKASIAYRKLLLQFYQLHSVLSNSSMRSLLIWWVSGNAIYMVSTLLLRSLFHRDSISSNSDSILMSVIFQVVYNYEVSIYYELNGSNDWNGTAIACILILGAGGAMAPVWMRVNKWDIQGADASLQRDEPHSYSHSRSQWSQGSREQGPWGATPSRGVGSVKRGTRTTDQPPLEAETEKETEVEVEVEAENKSPSLSSYAATEVQSVSYHLSVSISVLLMVSGVLSALFLLLFVLSWSLAPSIFMLALFFAAWQCVTAVFFVQLALCLRSLVRQGKSQGVVGRRDDRTYTIEGEEDDEGAEMTYSVFIQSPLAVKNTSRYVQLSVEHDAAAIPRSASFGVSDDGSRLSTSCGLGNCVPSCTTLSSLDAPDQPVQQMAETEEEKEQEEVVTTVSMPPPPANSLVFVAVVGSSAFVQCVLQTVLLSWLKCPLRAVCSILVFFFFLSTAVFTVQSALRIGPSTFLNGLRSNLSVYRQPQQITEQQQRIHTAPSRIDIPTS
jgi:Reduced folate carrier